MATPPVYSPVRLPALLKALSSIVGRSGSDDPLADETLREAYPNHAVTLTSSGTAALALALNPHRHSDHVAPRPLRVALPAYGCPDLLSAALYAGARVLLYDLDPRTLEPDYASLEQVLRERCSHVVLTHLYGRIVDVRPTLALADAVGATVIEDAAQHAGGSWQGHRAGGLGHAGVLSFGRGKGVNAGGGGALLRPQSSGPLPLEHERVMQQVVGLTRTLLTNVLSGPLAYGMVRRVPGLGIGATTFHRLADVRAASPWVRILLADALQQEERLLAHRRDVNAYYRGALHDIPTCLVHQSDDEAHQGALRFPVLLDDAPSGELEAHGVVRSYPRTLAAYSQIAPVWDNPAVTLRGAEELARRMHTLPTHTQITTRKRQIIVDLLRREIGATVLPDRANDRLE